MLLKPLIITALNLGLGASRTVLVSTEQSPATHLPPPAIPKIFDGHLDQGTALSEKFFKESFGPSESEFELCDLIGPESEWAMTDEAEPPPDEVATVLGSARQIRKSDLRAFVGDWKDVTFSQSRLHSGGKKPTLAEYRSVLSHLNGVFVLMDFQSPEHVAPDLETEDLPELQHLVDIVYLDWSRGMDKAVPPTWFLLKNITGHQDIDRDQDLSIVSYCLQLYKRHSTPPWPGITFPIGSTCFRAILGTYPSIEMGYLLLRYPEAAMASVTIYIEANSINMLWFGGKLDLRQLKAGEAANVAYEGRSPGKLDFSYGMVPGKDARIVPFRGKKRPASEMEE